MTITTSVIESLTFNRTEKRTSRVFYEIPTVYEPTPSPKRPPRSNLLRGASLNVPKNHYLASLLIANELEACRGKPANRDSLRRKMLREFPDSKKTIYYYFEKFSDKRNAHNAGRLYAAQLPPPLYCWNYNEFGFIYHTRARTLMGFEDCVLELKAKKFLDPRFFSAQTLDKWRARRAAGDPRALEFFIPLQEDIDKLSKALDKDYVPGQTYTTSSGEEQPANPPLYQSITFPEGYGPKYQ